MALFKKRSSSPSRDGEEPPWVTNPVILDPHLGMRVVDDYVATLRSGDFRFARAMLAGATVAERRTMIGTKVLASDPPIDTVEQWVSQAPQDGVGRLVLGALFVGWAFEARGGGRASTVGSEAWGLFFERLRRGEDELREAARLLPDAVEPWAWLLRSGLGLQIPIEELTGRFDEGHRREPFAPSVVGSMFSPLCAKWGGSDEKMFKFARWVFQDAPPGSPAIDVMALAHIEMVVSQAGDVPIAQATAHMKQPDVRQEVMAAADRSIFHPDFVDDTVGADAANTFLLAFYLTEDWVTTKRVLDLIDGRYTGYPSGYFGDPGKMNRRIEILTARNLTRMHSR